LRYIARPITVDLNRTPWIASCRPVNYSDLITSSSDNRGWQQLGEGRPRRGPGAVRVNAGRLVEEAESCGALQSFQLVHVLDAASDWALGRSEGCRRISRPPSSTSLIVASPNVPDTVGDSLNPRCQSRSSASTARCSLTSVAEPQTDHRRYK
jgi:hypothetical protein